MGRIASFVLVILFAALPAAAARRQQDSTANVPDWCRRLPRPEYQKLQRVPSADPWFEVYKVAPGVFAIYEPHQAEEAISFLILGSKRAAMFDTGLGIGDIKKVAKSLTGLPIVILNSHTHDDHDGDDWEFSSVYGMDTEFTRISARGSRVDAQAELAPGSVCGALPRGFDRNAYATKPFHITRWIHDGETIDLGGRVLEVIGTPGHTPDSINLLDRKNGLLFTGDTYYPGTIWLYRPETDLDAYGRSVEKIAKLAPQLRLVLCSHNVPVADPAVLPRLATAFRQVRAGKAKRVAAGPGQVEYLADDFSFLMAVPRTGN